MKKQIKIYFKIFNHREIEIDGIFDDENKTISFMSGVGCRNTIIEIDMALSNDIPLIIKDVQEKQTENKEKYKLYDINTIELSEVHIDGNNIKLNYIISADSYYRTCVGAICEMMQNIENKNYFAYPYTKCGVCW